MKKLFCIPAFSLFLLCANAQKRKLASDKEQLFTTEEINRLDSLLQGYYKKSGNLIVVCSDTLDVTTKMYKDSLIKEYIGDELIKPYAVFLLLSRRNSTIQLESNDLSTSSPGKEDTADPAKKNSEKNDSAYLAKKSQETLNEFMKIISAGIPAFKEKKREERTTIICLKAMEFLDALPKRIQ